MIDSRVETDLIHDRYASFLRLLIKFHHSRGDIGGCDDVLLLADGRLNDRGVVGANCSQWVICGTGGRDVLWDQAYGYSDLSHFRVKGLLIVHVKLDMLTYHCSPVYFQCTYADSGCILNSTS